MTPERWTRVKALFHASVELSAENRATLLAAEVGDDASLRQEVESLLAMDADEADVLEGLSFRPPALSIDRLMPGGTMEPAARPLLGPGHRIGIYEIVELLGSGGMGEVYRTRDTTLNRDVALKFISRSLAMNPDRLARFRREAQLLAALNHPNVAAIYGFEEASALPALVLELVEGPTLAARIADGPLHLSDALGIARQLAEGLEAAHQQGIVHRDLKPSNVHVRADGMVKILDFGLARSLAVDAVTTPDCSAEATPDRPGATRDGMILGTPAYMAPEQARGQAADTRADIWAFGCLFFEMLAGRPAFSGGTTTDVLDAVVTAEPDWSALPADLPTGVVRLLRRCLHKASRHRLQAIGDARIEIEEVLAPGPGLAVVESADGTARRRWIAALALLAAGLVGYAVRATLPPRQSPRVSRTLVTLPDGISYYRGGSPAYRLSLSPDGSRLAFAASSPTGSTYQLWVRSLDSLTAVPLPGTEMSSGQFGPAWSPDGRSLAYVTVRDLIVKKIEASGGAPLTLGQPDESRGARGGAVAGISWGSRDVILFGVNGPLGGPIRRVSGTGGAVSVVISPDRSRGETELWHPHFLPDGNHFLFVAVGPRDGLASKPLGLYASSLDGKERKLIMPGGSNAKYVNGHLLFVRDSALMAQRFDTAHLELRGDAVVVAAPVMTGGPTGATAAFGVSQSRVLAYIAGPPLGVASLSQLTWLDRTGEAQGTLGDPAVYRDVEFSNDAAQIVVEVDDAASRSGLWVVDVRRGLRTRLASDNPWSPSWTPDGRRVIFARAAQPGALFFKPVDGIGAEARTIREGAPIAPRSWSYDGQSLAVEIGSNTTSTNSDIAVMTAGSQPQWSMFLQTPAAETNPRFSPDGRWIAFQSADGNGPKVYVAPFPGPGSSVLVSTAAGVQPRWRADGREIFYINPTDNTLMAAAVNGRGSSFQVGAVKPLFSVAQRTGTRYQYDVTPDGKRFLVNFLLRQQELTTPITVVVNWDAGLEAK